MPGYPSSNPKQFIQGVPVHVPDVAAAVRYHRDVLGFISDFENDDYAVVWRDNSAIHFVKSDALPNGVHLFQWVRGVDAVYKELKGRGAGDNRRARKPAVRSTRFQCSRPERALYYLRAGH